MSSTSVDRGASAFERCVDSLRGRPHRWLVTGSAGFIGSHLVQRLLELDQIVVSVDNFSTGRRRNLELVAAAVGPERARSHRFIEGDIRDLALCRTACEGVDFVLHQAALGSVPRSMADPILVHQSNVDGFLNMLVAARDAGVRRMVYAASSAVYGDYPGLPKSEHLIGSPLSPYAATKLMNEIYAGVFARCYGLTTIGLRYFNVFGPRQDPEGPYSAVIPRWISALLRGQTILVNGDGESSRDFCYVQNVVQANLLAATTHDERALNQIFNVAVGNRTTLNRLLATLRELLDDLGHDTPATSAQHAPPRAGDVRHSQADISKAVTALGYEPAYDLVAGLREALPWFISDLQPSLRAAGRAIAVNESTSSN